MQARVFCAAAGKTSFEACGAMGIARCPLVAAQIFDNLVGRKYWNFVSTLSKTGAISHKFKREFDPGSESTLAARLTHASRTGKWATMSTVAYG